MEIVLASNNKHKVVELEYFINKMCAEKGVESVKLLTLRDIGFTDDIVEDGETFEENSFKKANEIMKLCGKTTISDDSGLMVDYLGGAPGVYSARFAGEDGNDAKNNEKLLTLLADVPYKERRAQFVSVITMVFPNGESITARGECPGHIIDTPVGENGFGYDPLFVPDGFQRTFAQLSPEEKNEISHRAVALVELERLLTERK